MNLAGRSHLALIILAVRDLQRSSEFYSQVFEWPILVDAPSYKEFQMPSGQRLGIYFHEGFGRNTGQPPTLGPWGQGRKVAAVGKVAQRRTQMYPEMYLDGGEVGGLGWCGSRGET